MPATPRPPAPTAREPGRKTDRRQVVGLLGERVAARWLERRGWAIVARRFRSGHRDLDLVARRGALVAFVEVKARRGLGFGDPIEAVRWRKQRELVRSANVWIDRHGRAGDVYRFDVVGVVLPPPARAGTGEGRTVRVRHVADAFQVPSHA